MPKLKAKATNRNTYTYYIYAIILATIFFVATHTDDFRNSLNAIKAANINLILISIIFSTFTFVAASIVYVFLSPRRLSLLKTLLVQVATGFTNRLLPAGSGGLATFARYLIKQRHTATQAAALVTVNNALGFVGLVVILLITVALSDQTIKNSVYITMPEWSSIVAVIFIVLIASTCLFISKIRSYLFSMIKKIRKDFSIIAQRPLHVIIALLFSTIITACYAGTLYYIILAFGVHVTVLQSLIVLTTGVAAASITPTPGGIGGAEAGLVAGLTSVGLGTDVSLSIALAYRFATFWLPMLPGFIAFQFALKKDII